MRINRALWIVVLTSAGSASSVDAQSRVNRISSAPQVSNAPVAARTARPAATNANMPAERALVAGYDAHQKSKPYLSRAPFRIQRERTPFLAQTRLPLVHLWDGRIELAVMRQSMRDVHSYSALPQADQPSVLRTDRIPYLQPASRSSYGAGIWLTFGRPRGAERKAS